jgi:hypothetical protein
MANTAWSPTDKSANITLTGGNLIATVTAGGGLGLRAADKQLTGKFYWEITVGTAGGTATGVGIAGAAWSLTAGYSSPGVSAPSSGVTRFNGTIYTDGVTSGFTLGAWTGGQLICIAVDCVARLIWYRLGAAGNWNGSASANPATGVGGVPTSLSGGIALYPNASLFGNGDQATANFGDGAFTGTVPSGFTSGFTAGATAPTNTLATQVAAEHWLTTNPQAQVTQVAAEHWFTTSPTGLVTQVAVEEWATTNALGMVTQVAVEEWASVQATYPRPANPTTVLSASRAGIGSVVVR